MQMRKCISKLSRCCCACSARPIQTTDDTRDFEAYQTLERLFDTDNMTILKHLIYAKDDIQPLVDGTTKSRVSLEVLRKKTVLLLISDFDIATEDIELLNHMCRESRAMPENQFEIVWLPIVDIDPKSAAWDMTHQRKFKELQSSMSWYTVYHPSILEPAVIKYIREVWCFSKSIIIVALDPQGKLASSNALHMTRIWGNLALPFTKEREEALWREESWTLKLIIDGLADQTLREWVTQGSYICLFGGEDLEWIKKLTARAKKIATIAGIMLGMVYVGKSNSNEGVQRTAATIISEKLSYCRKDPLFFWLFWARLESMFHSKMHLGKSIKNDPLLHVIQTILNFDRSNERWAVFCQGVGPDMVAAEGNIVLESIEEFDKWKDDANQKGFVNALSDHLIQKHLIRLFDEIHLDNLTILKHLIYAEDNIQPLVDGTTKSRVALEVLRKKTVLLLISDLDIAIEDIQYLTLIYKEPGANPENQFEMVWLPIVDVDPKSAASDMTRQQKFKELQSIMPWYTVHHPSILEPAVIKYIREEWRFSKSIIIVALDPQGRLASPNALHMIRIWGNSAFPFTKEREEALWREESWTLELIIDGLADQTLREWVTQGSYICVFGGEDLEWIRKLTATAKEVAEIAGIMLGMVYVGKSNSKEGMQRRAATIISEQLSHCWNDPIFFWLFWARLESMFHSKVHLGKSIENDPLLPRIQAILSYDRSDEGWAIFCQGVGQDMVEAKGNNFLESIEEFDKWKDNAIQKGFFNALRDHLRQKELVHLLGKIHLDKTTILKHIIHVEDDIQQLVDYTIKSRVSLEELRKKTVLLLISDFDIATEDIELLNHMYRESRAMPENQFEIVWLPIVDIDPKSAAWDVTHQQKFEELQSSMSWYTIHHPLILEPVMIKYIREVWFFSKSIVMVALDPQGKLASPNALHMIRIWGTLAFPFTKEREEALWREESWTLELIIGGLDDGTIKEWVTQGSSIFLFGSEDLEWIRKFTAAAKQAAKTDGITLEMVYVGKSNSKERVQSIAATIISEKLVYCWNDPTFFWLFWARLESILHLKKAHRGITKNDRVIIEIGKICNYDKNAQGWAILCRGAGMEMGTARSDIALLDSMWVFHAPIYTESLSYYIEARDYRSAGNHWEVRRRNRMITPGSGKEMGTIYRCCNE